MPSVRKTALAGEHVIAYQEAGPPDGPPVLLLHGLASDGDTWDRAIGPLAAHGVRVLAVDLLGHGESDKPNCAYLLSDFANSLLAFMDAMDLPAATLCGHSFGGAIAIYFGAQHPERVERVVLVAAGGLGREVHPVLRAAALPVAPTLLRAALRPPLRRVYGRPGLHKALRLTPDNIANLRRAARALGSDAGQTSFFASLRGVIAPSGQRAASREMRAFADKVPMLLIWNETDPVIPLSHARAHVAVTPASRLVVFPSGGHEPHRRSAERFADEVAAFVHE
ncbi:MAG TPA: alpha/beta fold hydrolase [Jatrophihabitans sp.]|jgi:pimeloyl-ACP methyl ester carboxylesterase|nr:alpha/beta fold hydrolase [Jatrophihabitans sp.]